MENQTQETQSTTTSKPKRTRRPSKRPRSHEENTIEASASTEVEHTVAETSAPKKSQAKAWSIDDFIVPEVEGKVRFHDLNLPDRVLKSIAEMGFEYCS